MNCKIKILRKKECGNDFGSRYSRLERVIILYVCIVPIMELQNLRILRVYSLQFQKLFYLGIDPWHQNIFS